MYSILIIQSLCDVNVSEDIFIHSKSLSIDGHISIVPGNIGIENTVNNLVINLNILRRIKVQLTERSS